MKRFVKLFGIFTLLMSLLLITGCGRYQAFKSVLDEIIYKGTTYVDNPTDASVTFTLDGTSYTVDAHSVKEIDLKEGAHTPVSYTHLDVYKRQLWYMSVSLRILVSMLILFCLPQHL